MEQLLKEFDAIAANRPYELIQAQKEGFKIVEYVGNYVPEELIYAAGAKAYPMWKGGEPDAPDAVLDESVRFLNPYARTLLGLYNLGLDPVSKFADMYVMCVTECHMARMAEAMERHGLPVVKIGVPADWQTPADYEYYKAKVQEFVAKLEELTGPIAQDKIEKYIGIYNEIRALLRRIDAVRKQPNPPISGSDFMRLNHYAALCDPEVALDMLGKIADKLEAVEPQAAERKPRVVVFGHAIAVGDYLPMIALEEAGADIVHEVLDEGLFRYENDVALTGDAIEDLCRSRYLETLPTDNFQPAWEQREAYVLQVLKDYAADAVMCYELLYDEIYDMEMNCFARDMSGTGVPVMRLQTSYEYTREAMGHLRTKVETFVDSIKGGF